jgi:GH15 family glucan-1,4-alpha-glucosidase
VKLEDYGLIGDTHSGGLVSGEGSIDWLCLPRFDSESCFAAILEAQNGGYWRIAPAGGGPCTRRRYLPETMILETTFETSTGAVELIDFLALEDPTHGGAPRAVQPKEIVVRLVRGLSGEVAMNMHFEPRFSYGDVIPWFRRVQSGIEAVGGPHALDLASTVDLVPSRGGVGASFAIKAGESACFFASYHLSHLDVSSTKPEEGPELLASTERFWHEWIAKCSYSGPRRAEVMRSLLTLKALTFSPTGGVVAAPTTSLPEQLGGPRNWDYRYCWLRDATFTLDLFMEQGFLEEAREWRDWLLRAVAGHSREMQIMYGLMGERRLTEWEVPWLRGYEGSQPVRIGNAAHSQFQLDVYGEVMDSFLYARRSGMETPDDEWQLDVNIVDFVCESWREPDEGIWEVRSERQHFVHSKVMAWVAVDRGIKAIKSFGMPGPLNRWRGVRDEIKWQVLSKGVDKRRGCFKRTYDDDELDASLLMLPQVGFIGATDPLMVQTVEAIQKDLVEDGLVLRYRTHNVDDGLPPGEGAFLLCSFWLVNCLVLMGRRDEAEELFDRLLGMSNDLGLLAEQYSPSAGRLLGNFPQAFSHVALVNSVLALESKGEAPPLRRGR